MRCISLEQMNQNINNEFNIIFEQAAVGMVFLHLHGMIKRVNTRFAEFLGYRAEDLIGCHVNDITLQEDIPIHVEGVGNVLNHISKSTTFEKRYIHKDGRSVWAQVTLSPIYDKDNKIVEFFAVVLDISNTKDAERRKREQALLFSTAMDSIPSKVFIKDVEGVYLACNSVYANDLKTPIDDVIGKKDSDFFEPYFSDKYRMDDVRIMESGIAEEIIEEYTTGGKLYWISTLKAPVYDKGKVIGIVGMFVDITEKKKSEDELEQHRNHLLKEIKIQQTEVVHTRRMMQMFFDTSVDLMCIINKSSFFENVNPSWQSDLGWSEKQIYRSRFMDFIHPDDKIQAANMFDILKNGNKIIDYELRMLCSDNTYKWFSWNFRGVSDFFVASARNVTAQRETERFLLESKDAAEKANNAKSEFIANMSHEIRTPLNAVIGFSELLAIKLKNSNYISYVDSINIAGQSLLCLINDILDLSKIEAGMMVLANERIQIRQFMKEIYSIFEHTAKDKGIDLIIEIDSDIPEYLFLDHIRMRQVLLNIVGNAIKFTENGYVKIKVILKKIELNSQKATIDIFVEDTGFGMDEIEMAIIFDSFRQSVSKKDQKYGGTGLGLSISKKLIEMMGGTITVESSKNQGSSFGIHLNNLLISKHCSKKVFKIDELLTVYKKAKILAVDDEPLNLMLLRELLNDRGLEVDCVSSGQEAIEKVALNSYDLIVMDLVMPGLGGEQSARRIRELSNGKLVPIICFSANITTELLSSRSINIFNDYLSKPVRLTELLSVFSKYLKIDTEQTSTV